MFLLKARIKFLWPVTVLTNCLKVTNVTKVYEEYIEFGTGSNHKKRRKTKKLEKR